MIYDKLSFYYDELVKDDQATQAWGNWIMDSVSSPCELLDLACGSAEISLLLAKNGFQVSALDLSQGMIQAAKEKDKKHKIQFYCQDMKNLSNLNTYDVITCLCDSFNYILSKEEVSLFFKEVSMHLKKDGLFFFDTHSLDRLVEFEEEFNETGCFEDCQYQWSILSEDDYIYQDFAFYLDDGKIVQEHHIQRVYTPEWLETELKKYFEILKVTTDFDLEGIQEGEKYFYVCRRLL